MSARANTFLYAGAVLVLLLAWFHISGCGRGAGRPQRRITSIHCTGGYSQAARELAADFEKQTGIHVDVVEAAFLSLREKEVTDLITRAGKFDVLQIAYQWDGEIFPHLRPLDEIAPDLVSNLGDFIPTVRTNCGQWGGRVYGVPMACDVVTLLYRKDIFEERSPEYLQLTGRPLRPPETWEEYVNIARFLNSESVYGNLVRGEQCYTIWSGILFGIGGQLVDEQWRPVFNSEAGVRSLALLVEMFKYAPPPSEAVNIGVNSAFLQGRGAMFMAWPTIMWSELGDTNRSTVSGKIAAAVIPGGRPELSSWGLSINPACKDIDAASQWVQFLVSPATTRRMLFQYGKGSPRTSTYSDPECATKVLYHSQLLQGLAGSQARLRITPSQELSDYLDEEILKAVRGETTPKAALDRAAARWREILAQEGYLKE